VSVHHGSIEELPGAPHLAPRVSVDPWRPLGRVERSVFGGFGEHLGARGLSD
jgi:hypothetical protein